MLSRCFLDFSVSVGAFVIGLSQISSFFSCVCPFYRLIQTLQQHCTLINKGVGAILRALLKFPQRRQDSAPLLT